MNSEIVPTRILAVDDDPTSRLMLLGTLQARGYDVTAVESAKDALQLLEQGSYMVVISDWNMPEMDGIEFCRAVRALNLDHYVYFILLTARTGSGEIVSGLAGGADDFISKPFDPSELEMRVKVGIRTTALDTRDAAIFALAKLAESRDPETGAHLERVRNYSRLLAAKLHELGYYTDQIDADFIRLIYATTPLHDIGKVAIPDSILLKPGRLSDAEFAVMKSHTTIGAETLAAVLEKYPWVPFLRIAHEIALYHHERWDGTGYPTGVSGDDIPLPARIMAVADVYDALVSKRVYKNAMEHDIAAAIIRDESGTHFDPRVVEAFIQLEDDFKKVREVFDQQLPRRAAA